MREIQLPSGRHAILSDTVGFISELPTQLIEAFRATLEEVANADIILHVRDAAHPDTTAQRNDVVAVLDGLAEGPAHRCMGWRRRTIEVLNKADLVRRCARSAGGGHGAIAISALTGDGLAPCAELEAARLGMEARDYLLAPGRRRGSPGCTAMEWFGARGVEGARSAPCASADHARFAQLPP
jgi:GTP-binding protein HflX